MNRTHAENIILRSLHEVGAVWCLDDLIPSIALGSEWNSPLEGDEREELGALWDHLIELGLVRLDKASENSSANSKRYYRITKQAYERLNLPGSESRMRLENEMRILASSDRGAKHMIRNAAIGDIASALGECARAIGYSGVRLYEAIRELTAAQRDRNDAIRENTRAVERAASEQRDNTHRIVSTIYQGEGRADMAARIEGAAVDRADAKVGIPTEPPEPGDEIRIGEAAEIVVPGDEGPAHAR